MAVTVQMLILFARLLPVLSWRDNRLHALRFSLLNKGVAVVTFVGDQMLCRHAGNPPFRFKAVRSGSVCSNDSDRPTLRIHGQMYLGVEPPFVRPIP